MMVCYDEHIFCIFFSHPALRWSQSVAVDKYGPWVSQVHELLDFGAKNRAVGGRKRWQSWIPSGKLI